MVHPLDPRRIPYEPDPEAEALLLEARRAWLDSSFRLARLFARLQRKGSFVGRGLAEIGQLGRLFGFDYAQARTFWWLGRALELYPDTEKLVIEGKLTLSAAALLGQAISVEGESGNVADWVAKATTLPLGRLRREVKRAVEKGRLGNRGARELPLVVPDQTYTNFQRCRTLASQEAGQELSEGQTFTRVVDHYLDTKDPLRREQRARRMPDTNLRPHVRGVPAAVEAALQLRSGGVCEVGDCTRTATEMAHLRPFREGSGSEIEDLFFSCHAHHVIYDVHGTVRFARWDEDRRPVFCDLEGREMLPKVRLDDPPSCEGGSGGGTQDGAPERADEGDPDGDVRHVQGPERGCEVAAEDREAGGAAQSGAGRVCERTPPYVASRGRTGSRNRAPSRCAARPVARPINGALRGPWPRRRGRRPDRPP